MSTFGDAVEKYRLNYQRRYIRTGSIAPVFHVMIGIFTLGVLIEAKAHFARVREGGHH